VFVLIIVGSIVFHVSEDGVSVNILNDGIADIFESGFSSGEFAEEVKDAAGIKGGSIFFISKNNAIEKIKTTVPSAVVSSIEKKFPNKITISVIKKVQYAYIEQLDGGTLKYITVDNEMRILGVSAEKPANLIRIYIDKSASNPILNPDSVANISETGGVIGVRETTLKFLTGLFYGLAHFNYTNMSFIDSVYVFSGRDELYVRMGGTVIYISGADNMFGKIHRSMSLYVNGSNIHNADYYRNGGVIRAWGTDGLSFEKDGDIVI